MLQGAGAPNRHLSAALVAAFLCAPTDALTDPAIALPEDEVETVVTGTRASEPTRIGRNNGAITVLDADPLDSRQTRAVSDILRDVLGVAVSRFAGQIQVRLRGMEANHVLVLMDGIEVSDPFSGYFDFGTLVPTIPPHRGAARPRMGGNEFMAISRDMAPDRVGPIADRLILAISRHAYNLGDYVVYKPMGI